MNEHKQLNNLELYRQYNGWTYETLGKQMGVTRQCANYKCKSLINNDRNWAKKLNIQLEDFLLYVNDAKKRTQLYIKKPYIPNNLELYRINKKLTYEDLAKNMGLAIRTVKDICRYNSVFDHKMAKKLNISVEEFLNP